MKWVTPVLGSLAVVVATTVAATTQAADLNNGRQVYEKWCGHCHDEGQQYPGTLALGAKYKGSKPAALEQRADLTEAMISVFVRNGVSVMTPFRKTEITDEELKNLAAYLVQVADTK